MKVIKVVVDEMPALCEDCIVLKAGMGGWHRCGETIQVIPEIVNVPDHRCLCIVEGAKE